MEAADKPLLQSWGSRALQLFSDEVNELTELSYLDQQQREAELVGIRAKATAEAEVALRPSSGANATSSSPQSTRKAVRLKGAGNNDASATALAFKKAKYIDERVKEIVQARDHQQGWRVLGAKMEEELHKVKATVDPVRAREHKEFEFFLSHNYDFFTMDEILSTDRNMPPTGKQQQSQHSEASPASAADAAGEEAAAAYSAPSSTAATKALKNALVRPPFIIDAVGFAEDYNATLQAEYSYRPAMGANHPGPSMSHSPAATDNAALKRLLDTHGPGLATTPPQFCSKVWNAATVTTAGAAVTAGGQQQQQQADTVLASLNLPPIARTATASLDEEQQQQRYCPPDKPNRLTSSLELPPIEEGGGTHAQTAPGKRSLGKKRGKKDLAATAAAMAGDDSSADALRADMMAQDRYLSNVDCSIRDRNLRLTSTAGQEIKTIVRFTNRNAHRMRLRVVAAAHPWLSFNCKAVAAVAGGVIRSGPSAEAEAALLSCGGYMEVEVTFEPQDTTEPLIEEVLHIGVTREVNARSLEGSQWAFLDVHVRCETALPGFCLYQSGVCLADQGLERLTPCPTTVDDIGDGLMILGEAGEEGRERGGDRTVVKKSKAQSKTKKDASERLTQKRQHQQQVTECCFPPTLVLAKSEMRFHLENVGSNAVVNILSDSPAFVIQPSSETATLLPQGDAMDLVVLFSPPCADSEDEAEYGNSAADKGENSGTGMCRGVMTIVVRDSEEGPVLSEHFFCMSGLAVVPHVTVKQLNDVVIADSGKPQWSLDDPSKPTAGEGAPRYLAEDTTPGVTTQVQVVVSNDSPISLPFYWSCEDGTGLASIGGCTAELNSAVGTMNIAPASGMLPAEADMHFTISITPCTAQPLITSWALFLEGMPDPIMSEYLVFQQQHSGLPPCNANAVGLYTRAKFIPSADTMTAMTHAKKEASGSLDSIASAAGGGTPNVYRDPFGAFIHSNRLQDPLQIPHAFATGFFVYAQPRTPSAVLVPQRLEEAVDCLIHYDNVRRVALQNHSPRPLTFIFDPTEAELNQDGNQYTRVASDARDVVSLKFVPRKGVVPAFGSIDITVRFTVNTPGCHCVAADCFIAEIMALTGPGAPCSHQLRLDVTGVGACLHTSTDLLDFGLVEAGGEAAASFTVTNDNPIPAVFDLQDPLFREPARFVFLPPSFRLRPGDSVEVTVYRRGIPGDDAQTFFELVVREGGSTLAIETRATIQVPTLVLDSAVVNFGEVPEGVWQDGHIYLSNASGLDIAFSLEAVTPPDPHVQLKFATDHVIRAGQSHVGIPIRGKFLFRGGSSDSKDSGKRLKGSADQPADGMEVAPLPAQQPTPTLLRIRSKRGPQTLLLEVRCGHVSRLSVSLDVVPANGARSVSLVAAAGPNSTNSSRPSLIPGNCGDAEERATTAYIQALLYNSLNAALDACAAESISGHSGVLVPLRPYCPPVGLTVEMADDSPVCSEELDLHICNYTGCDSHYSVRLLNYSPLFVTPADVAAAVLAVGSFSLEESERQSKQQQQRRRGTQRSVSSKQGHSIPSVTELTRGSRSATEGTHHIATSAIEHFEGDRPVFWATSINGEEQRERQRRAALAEAQRLLLDGRGCASQLTTFASNSNSNSGGIGSGDLGPHALLQLPISFTTNLPGCYTEQVRVQCGHLPPVDIPITYEVFGKPLLLDPTTSGLTTVGSHRVLIMPPVIASVGSSRRNLRVMNRAPRDINVFVDIYLCAASFKVVAVEEDADASQVVLKLGPLLDSDRRREAVGKGSAYVQPESFFMAAMSSKEVLIEYTPAAEMVAGVLARMGAAAAEVGGDGNDGAPVSSAMQEVDWRGSLVIHAEVTSSTFNDAFLMDEFYTIHADRFPSTRILRQPAAGDNSDAGSGKTATTSSMPWLNSVTQSIPLLQVMRPLRTRPGRVLRNNKMLRPTPAERVILEREQSRRSGGTGSSLRRSRVISRNELTSSSRPLQQQRGKSEERGSDGGHDGDGERTTPTPYLRERRGTSRQSEVSWSGCVFAEADDDRDGDASDNSSDSRAESEMPLPDMGRESTRPVTVLLAEEEEKQELIAFIKRRREEVRQQSLRYFTPIELLLRSRCGVPQLAVEPSGSHVLFPRFHQGQACVRTVRLTNRNSAQLLFTLRTLDPQRFKIVSVRLVPSEVEEDSLEDDSEESKLGLRALEKLKWGNITEIQRARAMLLSGSKGGKVGTTGNDAQGEADPTAGALFLPAMDANSAAALHMCTSPVVSPFAAVMEAAQGEAVYRLRCSDALDVTVELVDPQPYIDTLDMLHQPRHVLAGAVHVRFISTTGERMRQISIATTASPSRTFSPPLKSCPSSASMRKSVLRTGRPPALEDVVEKLVDPLQVISLLATFTAPIVTCNPQLLWFKPGQTTHDGREQPSYAQVITLSNQAQEPVTYELMPVVATGVFAVSSMRATVSGGADITRRRKVHEVVRMPQALPADSGDGLVVVKDNEARFQILQPRGVIPAASAGGVPGTAEVRVTFTEHSNVRYECAYQVAINGQETETKFLLRGDSRETEV